MSAQAQIIMGIPLRLSDYLTAFCEEEQGAHKTD
jgi:hypothetical protein